MKPGKNFRRSTKVFCSMVKFLAAQIVEISKKPLQKISFRRSINKYGGIMPFPVFIKTYLSHLISKKFWKKPAGRKWMFPPIFFLFLFSLPVNAAEIRLAVVGEPEQLRSKVEATLISLPYCKVIDIQNRKTLLNEIKMGQTGLFDESSVAVAGKMVGAEKILFVLGKGDTNTIRLVDIETGTVEGAWVSTASTGKNSGESSDYTTLIKKMLEGIAMNRAFAELKEKDSGKITVRIKASKNNLKSGEELQFQVLSDTSGYLTLIDIQPDGSIVQLLPNRTGMSNEISAGKPFDFPGNAPVSLLVTPPFGKDTLRAIVSKKPLNLFKKNELDEGELSSVRSGQSNFNTKGVTMKMRTVPEGDWGMGEIIFTTSEQ